MGIVGVGAIGRLHAENYAANIPNARLAAIADINLEAARTLSSSLGVTKTYSDYMQLLEDSSIDAVVLATPPSLKKQFTIAAAEHGKHVFCEKPMTLSMEDADEMVKAVERSKIIFQVGYQRRFDLSFVRAKESIERGEVGRVLLGQRPQQGPTYEDRRLVGRPKEERGHLPRYHQS